jgi:hypothetical protein
MPGIGCREGFYALPIGINLKIYELKTRRDNRKEIPQIPLFHKLSVLLSPSEIM